MKSLFKKIITTILMWEARLVIRKYRPTIVAITGSVGKTSTKDAVAAVLSRFGTVLKSQKSYNSELGVPLTILGAESGWSNPFEWLGIIWNGLELVLFNNKYAKYLVLEVGVGKPGDMEYITSWLRPDVVVFTRFGETPVHVEFFKSREHLFSEKVKLAHALKPDGILILNHDDADVYAIRDEVKRRTYTFGENEGATVTGSSSIVHYVETPIGNIPRGMMFRVDYGGSSMPVFIDGALGVTHMFAGLAALSVAFALDLNVVESTNALQDYATPQGRMKLLAGLKESILIDDTYNASPVATYSAIATLSDIKVVGRKIAVLGDMLELGKFSADEHFKIGTSVASVADVLITVGIRARRVAEGALDSGFPESNIFQFDKVAEAGDFLEKLLQAGDLALIKGSQGMRMERIVKEVMAYPEDAEKLLVRQDKEWQKKL